MAHDGNLSARQKKVAHSSSSCSFCCPLPLSPVRKIQICQASWWTQANLSFTHYAIVCVIRERGKESEEEEDHMLDVCLFGCQATQRRACGWLVSAVVSNVRWQRKRQRNGFGFRFSLHLFPACLTTSWSVAKEPTVGVISSHSGAPENNDVQIYY